MNKHTGGLVGHFPPYFSLHRYVYLELTDDMIDA
uniref:Uncharacterized protein n=1 Tax=Arundo donax TaxID=35708 RepID=A0A0A8Z7M6_ARUDO